VSELAFPKPEPRAKAPKALRRRRWMRARRPRRLDRAGSDVARLGWIHDQPCLLLSFDHVHRCSGRMEAAHEGPKPGVSMKCPDSETVPFCTDLGFSLFFRETERRLLEMRAAMGAGEAAGRASAVSSALARERAVPLTCGSALPGRAARVYHGADCAAHAGCGKEIERT